MQIHIVRPYDTLQSIATMYESSVPIIMDVNELPTDQLVVGQALVIPMVGSYYFVMPGDTLYAIANMYQTPLEEMARINHIPIDMSLPIGFRLYIPAAAKISIKSFGYIEPIGDTVSPAIENAAREQARLLTFLAPFSYQVNRDGTLKAPPLNAFQTIAQANQTALSFVVTNLEAGSFSSELVHIILTVQAVQNKLIDQIITTATTNGFQDVHIDFEFILPEDREAYNAFLRKLKVRTSQNGVLLSTALAPKTSSTQQGLLYEAHDYTAHGEIVDFVVLMTYEWGYSAGPPLPVSPINEVERVLQYALTVIPKEKILMGQNLYGYDWTLPFVQGESFARAISPQQAIQIALQYGVMIQYDETAQAPFFTYVDAQGNDHIVWFEDARSIQAKFMLIKHLGIAGIAYWKLGLSFPQNWLLLNENFTIEKRI